MVFEGIRKMIDMNPDWSWKVYEHDDIDAYIRAEPDRPGALLSRADVDLILKAHFVEHTDAARLLIMWHEGGFYQDTDRAYVFLPVLDAACHCWTLLATAEQY
jgi:mannosyltransferase OCH1-like enzyme